MVSTTRGTLSRAAAEKAEGKKPVTEEGSGSRKSGSGIHYLFDEMQLTRLMMNPQPAYQKETIEFLSTLRVNFYEPDEIVPEGHGSGRFSFRINKRKYRMSFKSWRMCFILNTKMGEKQSLERHKGASSLLGNDRSWRVHASTAKSTHIRNPVLRYVHKALAHTIYARRD
ncbi:unnamed protein product [Microthlaspi erraticum]|uniref:Arabidopsis retrotransposon Orf1 C-terminal domain-containing protein n=1 Tax=Microthlaspi erraticum TaxID=1685480 RepID=A0A6D2K2T7_9BRAS|nr:unnamed protein product [Microthlaspi erraticum]